jgi:hypothetical protein
MTYNSCRKGWQKLCQMVQNQVDYINERDKEKAEKIEILEMKEKFGFLDVSFSRYNDELIDLMRLVSTLSTQICEDCGKPAKRFEVDGWYYTLCDDCYDKLKNRLENGN